MLCTPSPCSGHVELAHPDADHYVLPFDLIVPVEELPLSWQTLPAGFAPRLLQGSLGWVPAAALMRVRGYPTRPARWPTAPAQARSPRGVEVDTLKA
jgi:hypothetical protein